MTTGHSSEKKSDERTQFGRRINFIGDDTKLPPSMPSLHPDPYPVVMDLDRQRESLLETLVGTQDPMVKIILEDLNQYHIGNSTLPSLFVYSGENFYGTPTDYDSYKTFAPTPIPPGGSSIPEEEKKIFGLRMFTEGDGQSEFKDTKRILDSSRIQNPFQVLPFLPGYDWKLIRLRNGRIITSFEFILKENTVKRLKILLALLGLKHFNGTVYEAIVLLMCLFKIHIYHHPRSVDYISKMSRDAVSSYNVQKPYIYNLIEFLSSDARIIPAYKFMFENWEIIEQTGMKLSPMAFFRFMNYFVMPPFNPYTDLDTDYIIQKHVRALVIRGNILMGIFSDLDDNEERVDVPFSLPGNAIAKDVQSIIGEYLDPIGYAAVRLGMVYPPVLSSEAQKLNYFYDNVYSYIFYLTRPKGILPIADFAGTGLIPTASTISSLYQIVLPADMMSYYDEELMVPYNVGAMAKTGLNTYEADIHNILDIIRTYETRGKNGSVDFMFDENFQERINETTPYVLTGFWTYIKFYSDMEIIEYLDSIGVNMMIRGWINRESLEMTLLIEILKGILDTVPGLRSKPEYKGRGPNENEEDEEEENEEENEEEENNEEENGEE